MKESIRRIVHVITGLDTGGAEIMLWKLLTRADRRRFAHEVISLGGPGPIGDRIADLGFRVRALGMSRTSPNPLLAFRLVGWICSSGADLVQTWMYHSDLLGGLAARTVGLRVVWGIHHSHLDPAISRPRTVLVQRACARLSHWVPAGVICCSEASRRVHAEAGYDGAKLAVIPNGFDLQGFAPDLAARVAVRRELGVADDVPLVGLVARYDPAKDHANFFWAAARVRKSAHFLLCGEGVDEANRDLRRMRLDTGLEERAHLLGRRNDIARIHAAVDVACLSSSTEAFPNVVGEAMACGIPCAVTDCGDAKEIVGEAGRVVPPRDSTALAAAIDSLLDLERPEREALGRAARERIEERYELSAVVGRYETYYDNVLRQPRA